MFDKGHGGRTLAALIFGNIEEHFDRVSAALERDDVSGKNGLADQLENIASKLVNEYWNDNQSDILILADSFLKSMMIIT